MKLKIFTLLIASTALLSCEKKQCWKCLMNTTTTQYEESKTKTETSSHCDKTQDEMDAYAKGVTRTTTVGTGNDKTTVDIKMACNKE